MFNRAESTNELQAILGRLFDLPWLCETTKVCLSLLQEVPETLDIFVTTSPAIGSYKDVTGVVRTEVCSNEDGIIEMLYGVSRKNVGEEYQSFVNVTPIERTYLSTASLAELVYRRGSVTLVNAADAVAIYEDISRYLVILTEKQATEPHYQPPPIEDINAFKALLALIEKIAIPYSIMNLGETPFAQLKRLMSGTASGNVDAEKAKLTLDGNTGNSQLGSLYQDSPYKFNTGNN